MYIHIVEMTSDNARIGRFFDKIIHEFKAYKYDHINYWDQYFEQKLCHIVVLGFVSSAAYQIKTHHLRRRFTIQIHPRAILHHHTYLEPKTVPFVGNHRL
jgi:hypothetical protein